MNIFNSLLPQLVKYDVHTTRKINSIHAIFYHILSFSVRPTVAKMFAGGRDSSVPVPSVCKTVQHFGTSLTAWL